MSSITELVNKRVPSSFMGERLFFDLSHALFSSFKVDDGSRLLLKSLARHGKLENRRSFFDVGCGVGVLGLTLKKRFPGARLEVCDRDALAVAMTLHNAEVNGITVDSASTALMDGLTGEPVDLLVCNVPAKAGAPVHEAFLASLSRTVAPGGLAALVIVTPLEAAFRRAIESQGHTIEYEERTANHLVLHLSPDRTGQEPHTGKSPYLGAAFRQQGEFSLEKNRYRMETAFGLPEFDTPSYATHTAAALAARHDPGGRVLLLNPGQGHLAAWLAAQKRLTATTVAGRDLLQLRAATANIQLNSPGLSSESYAVPWPAEAPPATGPYDWIMLQVDLIPGVPPATGMEALTEQLKSRGSLLAAGKSSDMHLFLKNLRGLELQESRKYRGFRAALLQKQG